MTVAQMLEFVNEATSKQFSWDEVDVAMIELHKQLSEPKWAIEDPVVRRELENMFVSHVVSRYLSDVETPEERKKRSTK